MSSPLAPGVPVAHDGRSLRWTSHREERKGALLLSAIEAVDRVGTRVTVEIVAAEAKVSRTVVHRYFGDRDHLADAIAEGLSTGMLEIVDARLADPEVPGARDRIAGAIAACVEVIGRYPNRWNFLREYRDGRYLTALYERVAERAMAALAAARGEHVGDRYIAQGIVGLVDFAGRAWSATKGASPQDFAASIRDAVCGLLDGVLSRKDD